MEKCQERAICAVSSRAAGQSFILSHDQTAPMAFSVADESLGGGAGVEKNFSSQQPCPARHR